MKLIVVACVADLTVVSAVPAKKHETSPAPGGHVVNKYTTVQNTAPKFGLFICFSHTVIYVLLISVALALLVGQY